MNDTIPQQPELPADVREAIGRLRQDTERAMQKGSRMYCDLTTVLAALADAQRDRERLIELLSAASKYVPAGALYGDILNKPVSETNLLGQIGAAMQEARR